METDKDANIQEEYRLKFNVYAQLGNTGLKSETKELVIGMNYDPIPSIPIWQKLDDIQRMDKFELVSLDKYLRAG